MVTSETQGTYLYRFKMNQISLIEKLDEFIRKYYRNKCLKGGLISVGIIGAGLLGVSMLEYLGRFDVLGRTILFYSVLVALVVVLYALLLSPSLDTREPYVKGLKRPFQSKDPFSNFLTFMDLFYF